MNTLVKLVSEGWLFLAAAVVSVIYIGWFRPSWLTKITRLFGHKDMYNDPFYYFRRWDWKQPPANWRTKLAQCVLWMILFGGLSIYLFNKSRPWAYIILTGLMSIHFAVFVIRIYVRVSSAKKLL